MPVPGFGTQLQDRAIDGFEREARLNIIWIESAGTYPDGTPYTLRSPIPEVTQPYTAFNPVYQTLRGPRPVFGLGLLEAVPDQTLLAMSDAADANGDGLSGRTNTVWDIRAQANAVGRFGWKASQPSLEQQIDAAYVHDMGVTTSLFPVEASAGQPQDDGLDDDPELDDERVADVVFYTQTLGVPARRDVNDSTVQEGEALFDSIGCAGCHVPSLTSGTVAGIPEISNQTFFPYTDLLLHDMGEGLSNGRSDFDAEGSEWRTPPLWGLGLADTITAAADDLHDARARSVEEAILWHAGEAEPSVNTFKALAATARAALLRFLGSL